MNSNVYTQLATAYLFKRIFHKIHPTRGWTIKVIRFH